MKEIVDLKNHFSPCYECLVKMCCTQFCNPFIIYYICVKSLIRLKLEQKGFNIKTKEGFEIYKEIMLNILHKEKNAHEKTIINIDQIIYKLERRKK